MSKPSRQKGIGWLAIVVGAVGSVAACTSEGRQYTLPSEETRASRDDGGTQFTDAATATETESLGSGTGATNDVSDDTLNVTVPPATDTSGGTWNGSFSDAGLGDADASNTGASETGASHTGSDSGTSDTHEQGTSAAETSEPLDFGVGEHPDFGQIAAGQGNVLVVNALSDEIGLVDVWLAGETEPAATGLSPAGGTRLQLESGAQRVVFTTTGTTAVVGCSEWFPLRPAEQWAVVPSRGAHDCGGTGDGVTPTFRQSGVLSGNPVRYVHAGVADDLSVFVSQTQEPGTLEPGNNLVGSNLADCSTGCQVGYEISADALSISRSFTFQVEVAEELPPQGEVLLIVVGDARQDWPAEANALRMIRADVDGTTRLIQRDPEVAFAHGGSGSSTFELQAPPSWIEIASANPDCALRQCELEVFRSAPGVRTLGVTSEEYSETFDVTLEAGRRYILLSADEWNGQAHLLAADFSRAEDDTAIAAAVNLDPDGQALTLGSVFGSTARAIAGMERVPVGEVSAEVAVPAEDGWRLSKALGDETLGSSCFYSTTTLPGFRGYFVHSSVQHTIDVGVWPPLIEYSPYACF